MSPGMIKVSQRNSQHALLYKEYGPENLNSIAHTYLVVAFGWLQDFPLPFIRLTRIIGQSQECSVILTNQRRPFIDVVDNVVQRAQGGIVADQQKTGAIFQQSVVKHGQAFSMSKRYGIEDGCSGNKFEAFEPKLQILDVFERSKILFKGSNIEPELFEIDGEIS